MNLAVIHWTEALQPAVPIIISVPHSGSEIPNDIAAKMNPDIVRLQPDTDWLVADLYNFAPRLGIAVAKATYSRLVVDLNRDPFGARLYSDGRKETSVVPVKTFTGLDVYRDTPPSSLEIDERIATYFTPYHEGLKNRLAALRRNFPRVLLYDAHSIARVVQTIQAQPFPDLILGNAQGKSADTDIVEAAWNAFTESGYDVTHNEPFRGGFITRSISDPDAGINCIQVERSQDIYMDTNSSSPQLDKSKVILLQQRLLIPMFKTLISLLTAPTDAEGLII